MEATYPPGPPPVGNYQYFQIKSDTDDETNSFRSHSSRTDDYDIVLLLPQCTGRREGSPGNVFVKYRYS
jgi:hypothetical protein